MNYIIKFTTNKALIIVDKQKTFVGEHNVDSLEIHMPKMYGDKNLSTTIIRLNLFAADDELIDIIDLECVEQDEELFALFPITSKYTTKPQKIYLQLEFTGIDDDFILKSDKTRIHIIESLCSDDKLPDGSIEVISQLSANLAQTNNELNKLIENYSDFKVTNKDDIYTFALTDRCMFGNYYCINYNGVTSGKLGINDTFDLSYENLYSEDIYLEFYIDEILLNYCKLNWCNDSCGVLVKF